MAYVLGYFAADGTMIENGRGGFYVDMTSTDLVLLEQVKKVTDSDHKISERMRRNTKWKVQYRIQIGSREWFKSLSLLGFTANKSKTLNFPSIPEPYIPHFIRGYFDGDGCISYGEYTYSGRSYKRWTMVTLFTSGSRTFLATLNEHMQRYGVGIGYMRTKERGFDLRFSHRDSLALYRLLYHTGAACDLFLPRKREKFEQAIQVLGLETRIMRL